MTRVFVAAMGLAICSAVTAGEVKLWRQNNQKDFRAGTLARVVVSNEGAVSLSRQIEPLAETATEQVWTVALDAPRKLVYVATGSPGAVLRFDAANKRTVLHQDEKEQVFSLAVAADGTVYAGVSPSGKIYRYREGQAREEVFNTGETYVWALALDADGNLLAATGPNGKLFKIDREGKGAVLFHANQPHLLSLALAPSGVVYFGTSRDGLIYKFTPPNKAFVLHDADQADIHCLLLGPDETLYAGTGSPARPKLPTNTMQNKPTDVGTSDLSTGTPNMQSGDFDSENASKPTPTAMSPGSSGDTVLGAAGAAKSSSASTATPGENAVFKISNDGRVEEIFRDKVLMLSLALQGERLLVGTGQEGRLFQVDLMEKQSAEVARLEHGQVNVLASGAAGEILVGTSTPGKLYRLEDRFASQGTLLSTVFDAKMQTRWGTSATRTNTPDGSSIELSVRAGNVAEPDNTWTSWTAHSDKLPLGRFFQYQVQLNRPAGKATPNLNEFLLYYATVNQPPQVEGIEVPNVEAVPLSSGSDKVKLKWRASDPNGDSLAYRLEVKKVEWPQWVELAKDLNKTEFDWEPGSMPGGEYSARVTATDKANNRQEETLSSSRVSDLFVLDRDLPTVKLATPKVQGKRFEIRAEGHDQRTRITAAAYAIDGKDWIPLTPDDGLFDQRNEEVTFTTEELEPGAHVLMVRFKDSAGHLGVADTILTVNP
ncbi:MAG: hypothetical protein U1D30_08510 [Planctomycetota bacterium]